MKDTYKIAIVDDHPLFLDGLVSMFKGYPEFEVVCLALSGIETLNYLTTYKIRVLISDINMPQINGIELCRKIKLQYPEVAVLIISMHEELKIIKDVMDAGASGYLFKNSNKNLILEAIHHVLNGGIYYSDEVKHKLLSNNIENQRLLIPSLTKRENEVLNLVSKGLTTDQIAEKLSISHHTVLSHRKNLLIKFDVNNTISLIKKAMEANLIN